MVPSAPITAGLGHLELNDLERWGRSSSASWGEITEHPEGPS